MTRLPSTPAAWGGAFGATSPGAAWFGEQGQDGRFGPTWGDPGVDAAPLPGGVPGLGGDPLQPAGGDPGFGDGPAQQVPGDGVGFQDSGAAGE
jgi:hypothetical protein